MELHTPRQTQTTHRPTGTEACQEGGGERDAVRHGPDDSSSQGCIRRVPLLDAWCGSGWRACSTGGGRHLSLRCGRRDLFSGKPWSTPSTSASACRFSMLLCRRWGSSCWRSSGSWTPLCRSRLSTCPSLTRQNPAALGRPRGSSSGGGGTVNDNTNHLVLSQAADCRADRRHSSSAWSWEFRRRRSSRFSPRTRSVVYC